MPELPEVETVVRHLAARLPGQAIVSVTASGKKLRFPTSLAELQSTVEKTIVQVRRRAKYILCELSDSRALLFHLGMTGRLVLEAANAPLPAHTHVVFHLGTTRLRFTDVRRFGLVRVVSGEPEELASLGAEPFDAALTANQLFCALRRTRRAIKEALLDQRVIAGLGNIYVCETLFHAGMNPRKGANRVTQDQAQRLLKAIRKVLRGAIDFRGTTLPDSQFVGADGEFGENWAALFVFGRENQPCRRCLQPIRRIRQGSRSTFFCPGCQRNSKKC